MIKVGDKVMITGGFARYMTGTVEAVQDSPITGLSYKVALPVYGVRWFLADYVEPFEG